MQSGERLAIAEINRVFSPIVVELLGQIGYSCVWVDMEHSHLSYETLSDLVVAARAADIDIVVRLPKGPYNVVSKALELGVDGFIWPHCLSADEARQVVRLGKFRPLGMRAVGGGRDLRFGMMNMHEYLRQANEHTMLGVMIEDASGVDEVDEIAAVEGIDLLFFGPGDLSHNYGVEHEKPNPLEHPKIQQAMEKTAAACRKHNKVFGTRCNPDQYLPAVVEKGARWINVTDEIISLREGYANQKQASEKVFAGAPS